MTWNSTLQPRRGFIRPRAPRPRGKVRKSTGQRALFVRLYEAQGGRCAISGEPLLHPVSFNFHCQGSHLLPKGSYKRGMLWSTNVIMILKAYHDLWGNTGNKWDLVNGNDKLEGDERWRPYVERYYYLQTLYNTTDYNGEELTGRWAMDNDQAGQTGGSAVVPRGNHREDDQADDLPF